MDLRPIPGFPDYLADDNGEIWSDRPGRWGNIKRRKRKWGLGRDGYRDVVLYRADGKKANKPVHVLVALAFLGAKPIGLIVTHLNGDRTDNRPRNLSYRSHRDNAMDKRRHGTMLQGDSHPRAETTDARVLEAIALVEAGVSQREVARRFRVHPTTIWGWRSGKSRRHLNQKPQEALAGIGAGLLY